MRDLRVLFITREGRWQPGARIRSYGLSSQLRKMGFDADVFSFADHLGAKAGKDEAYFFLREKTRYAAKGLCCLVRSDRDVFIINRANYHAFPAILASGIKRAPFIFDMDDWEAREKIGSKAELLTRLLAKRARVCVAASRYLNDYLSQFNKNVYYLPTGVDLDAFKFKPLSDKDDFVFSWHGSVNRREILEYTHFLIECFMCLRERYDFIKLWIAADGIYGGELKKMIEGYRLTGLEYKGWVEPDDVPRYLEGTSVGLIPLFPDSRFNLSKSPVKLLEYMAAGKPVIASPTGEAKHIVKNGHNGFLARDKHEFVYYMEELIKDISLARNLGMNGRTSIEKEYSLEGMGRELYQIIMGNL